jgi:hypothetical protein
MKFRLFLTILCFPVLGASGNVHANNVLANLPLSFEANHGQAEPGVKYLARGPGYTLHLTATEVTLAAHSRSRVLRMKFAGGNRHARIEPLDPLPGISNYFIGNDPSKWRTNVQNYAKVALRGVYPGIDLIFYGNQQQLEYDVVVAPRADPNHIRLKFAGANRLRREASGDVIVSAGGMKIRQRKPVVYQMVDGQRRELDGGYIVHAHNEVAFEVARYDAAKPIVIDPVLVYSTYLGGPNDVGLGIAVDSLGNAYVTGMAIVGLIPVYALSSFVTKIDPQGRLVYSTYLSGTATVARATGIAVDPDGNAYVTGSTIGGFPIVAALQPNFGGGTDAFVTKLNPQGNALLYSTYLGGSGQDGGNGIAVDANRNVLITGVTSGGFPLVNALQPNYGGDTADGFVAKINAQGSALVYSSYLGGSGQDVGNGIAVDASGNALVTGFTGGGIPLANALQSSYGGGSSDAFVAKLNPQGTALIYSTYLGGTGTDNGRGIAVDSIGNAYVIGSTDGGFPLANAFQPTFGGESDFFVTKINPQGTAFVYSTYLGGSGFDVGQGIAVDSLGNAYVTGLVSGPNALVASTALVAKISAQGTGLVYATYLGGSGPNAGEAIAVDSNGNAYITGYTGSQNFPILSALQGSYGGGSEDAFVSVISSAGSTGMAPIFGSFDTPIDGANKVVGAVGVTGWALATFGVSNVEIYRDPVGNEPTGPLGLVFVGDAVFVPGARPDVQARYPTFPNADRAGWGYLLLTNNLPNQGNGTFRLHAIASDAGGNVTELGAPGKTITCTNANSVKPFGTIDTPGQGATVRGIYLNFGWALTPGASFTIPTDGSTISVLVDGVPLGHPTYNQYRSDIATVFPGYTNALGAVGFFYLDATKLANGLHTISWVVYDDHNRSEGIGSRYFTVAFANGAGNVPAETEREHAGAAPDGGVTIRLGNDLKKEPVALLRDDRGQYFIEVEEFERIELHAGANGGYTRVAGSSQPLPVGSTLEDGVFYWQLGPGFLGEYQLVLARPDGGEVPVRILVRPKKYSP